MTGTSSLGSSGWSTFQRYDTESGQRFFVKQARELRYGNMTVDSTVCTHVGVRPATGAAEISCPVRAQDAFLDWHRMA